MSYLGTNLSPKEYYLKYSSNYSNPHANEIINILNQLSNLDNKIIIDYGCGDGLVTKSLSRFKSKFIGIDSSDIMINRYKETGHEGIVSEFGKELPQADILIACYSLHLAKKSYLPAIGAWSKVAGIKEIIIISPLKSTNLVPGYNEYEKIIHVHKEFRNKTYAYKLKG